MSGNDVDKAWRADAKRLTSCRNNDFTGDFFFCSKSSETFLGDTGFTSSKKICFLGDLDWLLMTTWARALVGEVSIWLLAEPFLAGDFV